MAQTGSQSLGAALSGLSFRNNLNTILAALFSGNSGATAPSPTVQGMPWLDTGVSPPVLRVRNTANTAWIAVHAETIPANTLRGNSSGSAAAEGSIDMTALRTMLAITTAGRNLIEAADLAAQKVVLGFPQSGAGVGQWQTLAAGTSTALVLPAGGTWAYFFITYNTSGAVLAGNASLQAGGATLNAGSATTAFTGFCWRVA